VVAGGRPSSGEFYVTLDVLQNRRRRHFLVSQAIIVVLLGLVLRQQQGSSVAILPTPSVTETPTSTINPSVYLQPTTLSAMVDTGGVVPNGTVTFTGNGAILGTSPVSTVSTTNLIPYSQQLTNTSSWTAYCAASNNFSADTANTTDLTAPDGTYTSTRFIVPGSGVACGSSTAWGAFSAMSAPVAGNTYTVSMWLRGASGGETVQFGLNDCAKTTVTLTTSWTRYEATFPALSSATASCDGGRMMEFLGLTASTYYAWGAQVETSSGPQMVNANPAGPYVPTTSSSATGYGGTASLSVSFSAPGSNSVVASYSGNSTVSGSTSPAMIQTVFGGGSL
jgi:hypothetical protein